MTFDLGSGHIKVVADTANDSDCTDGCPVRSVKSFVERNGGFAGINGTYFCPTSYADCAGKTNSFYWKVLNSRLGKMMNADNKLGEEDPFYAFSSTGKATFYTDWVYYGGGAYAGISSKPLLIKGGGYAVKDDHLDSNQKTAKVQRAALGLKGQTFYVVVIQSATVYDLAYVMQELGVDNAMNIDGGGSTAMTYKGIMRRGPGRDVPNALIFVEN
jgi:exopolysaccharide biosynthesis protein